VIKILFLSIFLGLSLLNAKELTLNECIDKAVKNHPDIKRLSLGVSKSGASLKIAKADYMPQINLGAQYNPLSTFTLQQSGQFNTTKEDSWQVDAILNQKIYDFSKTSSTIKAYEKDENIADLSLNDAKALLIYNVKNLYNTAVVQMKAIEVRKKDLHLKEELYKQAEELVKQGLKTTADASSIQSALYIAEDNLAVSNADLYKAFKTLSLYMGEEIGADTVLEETLSLQKNQPKESKDLLLKNAMEQNFALKSSVEEIEKNSFIYDATKAQNYGSIDAVASYSHQNNINEYDMSLIGVTFKVPLYSGGRIDAQTQQAHIAKEIAKESYNSKKLLIQEEVESMLIDLQRYSHTLMAKESLINSSKATKEIVEARYKEGLATYVEILDAASTHLYAELGLLEAKFAINKIINRLEYLQGEKR